MNQESFTYVKLDIYLQQLTKAELAKPIAERRDVPTMTQIAEGIGVNKNTISRMVRGKTKSMNLDTCTKIIDELRRYGFETQLTDVIDYQPATR